MVIQANMYPQNIELPISSQDYFSMAKNLLINHDNNNNNNFVNNEFGFNDFDSQQKLVQQQQFQQQLLQQQQQQQQRQQQLYMVHLQNMKRRNSFVNDGSFAPTQPLKKTKFLATPTTTVTTASTTTSESDNLFTMNFSQSLSLQLEKQRQEMDRFVELQNEWLKVALEEQRKQQLGAIIRKLEVKAVQLLKQKDDEIAEATKKRMELEQVMRKMEMENQTWQRISAQNEAMVISLKNTLEQLEQQQEACSSSSSNNVNDVESCCKVSENKNQIEETEETTRTTIMAFCKGCNSRNASVLMLPCRHMCCCKVCDDLLHACPLCKSPKMASIHALIS